MVISSYRTNLLIHSIALVSICVVVFVAVVTK